MLEVLICTMGIDGLRRVEAMLPAPEEGIAFVVSCQLPGLAPSAGIPAILREREDVTLGIHNDSGLSRNRNHALDMAAAPFVLLADDDLSYYPGMLRKAALLMSGDQDTDIFAFRFDGLRKKVYPPEMHDLANPYKNYNVSSVELAFRLAALRKEGMRFSELAGIGAPYLTSGEENIFLERCLRKGMRGKYIPLTLCRHAEESTGHAASASAGHIRATGAYIRIKYGLLSGFARCLLLGFRAPAPTAKAMKWALQGYVYSIRHDREL